MPPLRQRHSACARWRGGARALGPKGIHVAHLVIDAGVDTVGAIDQSGRAKRPSPISIRRADAAGIGRQAIGDLSGAARRLVIEREIDLAEKW
jgi:hypothetical protein